MRLKVYYNKEFGKQLLDMFEDVEAVVWCPYFIGSSQGAIFFYTLTPSEKGPLFCKKDTNTLWPTSFVIRRLDNIWYRGKDFHQTLVSKRNLS